MRLHLVISRHGLPVTRILWTTTSSSSALGEYGSHQPASASMVASSRTPNIAFANGGYTIAQLLEDVNEVVPLETEPTIFDPEFSGQWGLEDYVVEVGGSECLHFMEVDGLLRDGDEVVIRALQLADLRARRICGRHQITGDGKHLIDGVPFGMPFYKRTTSTRPAITIPPRKKRRTVFSGWNQGPVYGQDGAHDGPHGDRAGDEEWLPENNVPFGKELSVLPADHEVSDMGTVIRHPVNYSGDVDELMDDSEEESYQTGSDEDEADIDDEADELEDELKALKEEFEISEPRIIGISSQPRESTGPALRASSIAKRPLSSESQGKSSLAGASSLSSKRSAGNEGSSPRISKAVRFNRGTPLPSMATVQALENEAASSSTESSDSSDSSAESEDEEDEDEDENSSDEGSSDDEVSASSSADPDDSNDTGTTSSSEDTSESEAEMPNLPASRKPQPYLVNPPGMGSTRTKKSNMRFKQRRRLSKLKELGILPENADFAALREWEDKNGGFHIPEGTSVLSAPASTAQRKEDEQREFEARREKLLRDLATGGVNVDEAPGKKRKQPSQSVDHDSVEKTAATKDATTAETSDRRKLDIESSRRMLFGSLGVRTPKTEDDVEATRRKLAAQASTVHSQRAKAPRPREEDLDEESDANDDWEKKLVIKAVECIHDDVVMTAPPFPFEQRWDGDADALIRQRNGWGKKRKRKQRVHIYDGDGQDEYDDHYGHEAYGDHANEAHRLNYDDEWPTAEDDTTQLGGHQSNPEASSVDDLPMMPHDPSTLADLPQKDIKVGSIIAYQRLEMSKATNWQPRLSEYRVAEVHEVLGDGNLKIRRALRDRRPKAETVDSEDDQPRTYSGFEMPGMDDDGEEDDGFDEVNVADLAGPKLLRPATMSVNDVANDEAGENGKSRDAAKEGSTVSVVEDSMPNNEPDMSSPPSIDVDMDETTFVTLETADSRLPSPRGSTTGAAVAASSRTPAAARVVITRSRYADDEYSESPAVPSPVFSGFHSARSSPGARLGRRYHDAGDSGLDGHTLIGDQSMPAVDPSNQDWSTHTSFLSANQSFSDTQQDSTQQDRQVVENDHIFASNESLVSVVHHPAEAVESHLTKPSPSPSAIPESPTSTKEQEDGKASPAQGSSIKELLNIGWPAPGDTDAERDEVDDDANDQDDQDSLIHSNQSRDLSSRLSSRSITSAQRALGSSPCLAVDSLQELVSPTTSTRSRRPRQSSPSLLDASQTSQVIDLTQSPLLRPSPDASALQSDQQPSAEKNTENDHPSSSGKARQSLGRIQEMAEVVVSPGPSQKAKKKKKKRRVGTDA